MSHSEGEDTNIQLLYFARLREQLQCDSEFVEISGHGTTVEDVLGGLVARGELWSAALGVGSILFALNQTIVDRNAVVESGDVLAMFPPVTGG